MTRTLLITALLAAASLRAQTPEELLADLSALPDGPERLALLARVTRLAAAQKDWEEVLDLAGLGADKARELDLPEPCAEFELVMAEAACALNDPDRSLAHALRAHNYSLELDPALHGQCALFLARTYFDEQQLGKAHDYAQQALATRALGRDDQCAAMLLRARSLVAMDDRERGTQVLMDLTAEARQMGDTALLFAALGMHATLATRGGSLPQAISLETERLGSALGKEKGIVLNNLGELHARLGDHQRAHQYFGEAATWLALYPDLYGRTLVNSSVSYAQEGQLDMAEQVITNAILVFGGRGSGRETAQAMLVHSGIQMLGGRFVDAMATARQALDEARRTGSKQDELDALDLMSRIALERGALIEKQQIDARSFQLRQDLALLEGSHTHAQGERSSAMDRQERDISSLIGSEQRERLRAREAILAAENQAKEFGLLVAESQLQEERIQLEAMARVHAQQELNLLQGAMAGERQQVELARLRSESDMQMLRLNKLDLERKQKEQSMAMLKRQYDLLEKESALKAEEQRSARLVTYFSLAAVVVASCTALFFFWIFRKVKGKNRVIKAQVAQIGEINAQLSDKNADLLSSITYAEHIQRSIIPTEQQLRDLLPDSFLYYRPRDIVSGDLPFVRSTAGRVFIATIDCTGHGVPAAMLSFMAYYNLNDIINTHPAFGVNRILGALHERIREAVHGRDRAHAISDGMDITLVELDPRSGILYYSGAQNSLLLVRDGRCERIRGDRCSIGDPSGDLPTGFTIHRLELRTGDRVYLYSDGLIHQFGGAGGRRKFSNGQLASTVLDLAARSAVDAGAEIAGLHQDWQGSTEQTDDIVLIGFSLDKQHLARYAA